jgi:hypothetical protein
VASALSGPSFNESGIQLETLLSVTHRLIRLHQLDKGESPITIDSDIGRVTAQTFLELLNRTREVTSLEKVDTLLFVNLRNISVKVSFSLLLLLDFF